MLYVMLVGAYPFERPEDKTDTQKLQKMIQVTYLATLQQPWSHAAVCMQQQRQRQRWQLVHQHNRSGSWSFHGDQQHIAVVVAACLGSAFVVVVSVTRWCVWLLLLVVLQRILKVDYHIPSHIKLSPEGHDLLKKVLVADPANRINIQQVRVSMYAGRPHQHSSRTRAPSGGRLSQIHSSMQQQSARPLALRASCGVSLESACGHAAVMCVPQIYDHPWYNKNLPPGVKEMNDHPQPLPVGLQSQEEIQKIVAVRRRCHALCGACSSLPLSAVSGCPTGRPAWVWLLSVR